MKMFNEEIQNTNTNYFIFDTGKAGHRDLDFNYYTFAYCFMKLSHLYCFS